MFWYHLNSMEKLIWKSFVTLPISFSSVEFASPLSRKLFSFCKILSMKWKRKCKNVLLVDWLECEMKVTVTIEFVFCCRWWCRFCFEWFVRVFVEIGCSQSVEWSANVLHRQWERISLCFPSVVYLCRFPLFFIDQTAHRHEKSSSTSTYESLEKRSTQIICLFGKDWRILSKKQRWGHFTLPSRFQRNFARDLL